MARKERCAFGPAADLQCALPFDHVHDGAPCAIIHAGRRTLDRQCPTCGARPAEECPSPPVQDNDGTVFVAANRISGRPWLRWSGSDVDFPPRSPSGYRWFHGETIGLWPAPAGRIVAGVHAAPPSMSGADAIEWYAKSGPAIATVRAEETDRGIDLNGHLLLGMGSAAPYGRGMLIPSGSRLALSGDWRFIDGHLELVVLIAIDRLRGFRPMAFGHRASATRETP